MTEPTTAAARRTALDAMIAAMRSTREARAGMAFGIPTDAQDDYWRGVAQAGLVALIDWFGESQGIDLLEFRG